MAQLFKKIKPSFCQTEKPTKKLREQWPVDVNNETIRVETKARDAEKERQNSEIPSL